MRITTLFTVLSPIIMSISICCSANNSAATNIFSYIKDSLSGTGTGEITPLGSNKFDISVAAPFSQNKGDTIAKWERTADSACNGGQYEIIERDFDRSAGALMLDGVIVCTTSTTEKPSGTLGTKTPIHYKTELSTNQVISAQNILNKLGYSAGNADGKAGPATVSATRLFQKDNNLDPSETLDKKTLERLYKSVGNKKYSADNVTPHPAPAEPKKEDITAKLTKLAKLKENGIITDEEFKLLKQKALEDHLAD